MTRSFYIECADDHTRICVLGMTDAFGEDNTPRKIMCLDGEERNLIPISVRAIISCVLDMESALLKFKLFEMTALGIEPILLVLPDGFKSCSANEFSGISPEVIQRAFTTIRCGEANRYEVVPSGKYMNSPPIPPNPRNIPPTRERPI